MAREPDLLICVESFVGFYDDEGTKQFAGRADRTIVRADSREAKLWGKFFEPVSPTVMAARQAHESRAVASEG